MPGLQGEASYSAASCGALVFLIFLASQTSLLAQNTVNCMSARPTSPSLTDAVVELSSPSRAWQMVGRKIEVKITSTNLPADAKPQVCFSWRFKDRTRKFVPADFVPADNVRIIPQSQASQQP